MSDGSSIEWCHATWTIAVGCTRVDHRCDHCYAISFVHRKLHPSHEGLTKIRPKPASRPGVDWNGTVRTLPERLADPLRWKKPRRVFVGSMTDLFHPQISFEYIAAVFGVMASTPRHTYLVLTKRPERAREFFAWLDRRALEHQRPVVHIAWAAAVEHVPGMTIYGSSQWPLPNVHLGVSVSDQATFDMAVPELLRCPAAIHWISYEPALGPVDIEYGINARERDIDFRSPADGPWFGVPLNVRLRWIVVGGESGPGAREMNIQWARNIIAQTRGEDCPTFVKQLGAKPRRPAVDLDPDGAGTWSMDLVDRKGGDMTEWPADLRIRELPT